MMLKKLCDLHCDTITACMEKGEGIARAAGHISLAQAGFLDAWTQVFAIFVPDELRGKEAAAYYDRALAFYRSQEKEIKQVCTPVLSLENANALSGNLRRLDTMRKQGVRFIALTWNGKNELGHGAHCDPALGLTALGKQAVRRMRALGIVPDVSHLNPAGFGDVAAISDIFVASHSNCAAVHPHRRNLNDDQIRAIIARHGLIGLNLYPEFLGGEDTAQALARHLRHIIALGGEDHAALGSDFDGCATRLSGLRDLPALAAQMAVPGIEPELTPARLEKFFWLNGANFFKKHLQNPQ